LKSLERGGEVGEVGEKAVSSHSLGIRQKKRTAGGLRRKMTRELRILLDHESQEEGYNGDPEGTKRDNASPNGQNG